MSCDAGTDDCCLDPGEPVLLPVKMKNFCRDFSDAVIAREHSDRSNLIGGIEETCRDYFAGACGPALAMTALTFLSHIHT